MAPKKKIKASKAGGLGFVPDITGGFANNMFPDSANDKQAMSYNYANIDTPARTQDMFIDMTKSQPMFSDTGYSPGSSIVDKYKQQSPVDNQFNYLGSGETFNKSQSDANPTAADTSIASTSYKPSADIGGTNWWGGKDQTYAQSQNELSNSFHDYQTSTGDKTTTFSDYQKNASDFARNENQQFNNYAGAGLGALQLGASLYSTFGANGSMAMNKKNMQLMDGQIANNNDIMATRKARAADITKYFG